MTISADFEALQTIATGVVTPTLHPEAKRGIAVAGSSGGSYGGWFVGQGGTIDAAVPTVTRVFKDGPTDSANTITPTSGAAAATDVWEEVYVNNAKAPTYVLRAHKGNVFTTPVWGHALTYQDFGS